LSKTALRHQLLRGEKAMETTYGDMSDIGLKTLLVNTQDRLDDKEDELRLVLEQSQSGQHISSKYIRSHCERIEGDIESLKSVVREVEREMEKRKN
jgi:archaellum component FlaC